MPVKLTEDMVVARSKGSDLHNIKKLNCWGSELSDVSVIRKLTNVEVLSLSVNQITTLADFQWCKNLQELYIRKNNIKDINELLYLRQLPKLKSLWLADNPCAQFENYRLTVLRTLPHLQKLDNVAVEGEEVQRAMVCGVLLPQGGADADRGSDGRSSESGGGGSLSDYSPPASTRAQRHQNGYSSPEREYPTPQPQPRRSTAVYSNEDEDEDQPSAVSPTRRMTGAEQAVEDASRTSLSPDAVLMRHGLFARQNSMGNKHHTYGNTRPLSHPISPSPLSLPNGDADPVDRSSIMSPRPISNGIHLGQQLSHLFNGTGSNSRPMSPATPTSGHALSPRHMMSPVPCYSRSLMPCKAGHSTSSVHGGGHPMSPTPSYASCACPEPLEADPRMLRACKLEYRKTAGRHSIAYESTSYYQQQQQNNSSGDERVSQSLPPSRRTSYQQQQNVQQRQYYAQSPTRRSSQGSSTPAGEYESAAPPHTGGGTPDYQTGDVRNSNYLSGSQEQQRETSCDRQGEAVQGDGNKTYSPPEKPQQPQHSSRQQQSRRHQRHDAASASAPQLGPDLLHDGKDHHQVMGKEASTAYRRQIREQRRPGQQQQQPDHPHTATADTAASSIGARDTVEASQEEEELDADKELQCYMERHYDCGGSSKVDLTRKIERESNRRQMLGESQDRLFETQQQQQLQREMQREQGRQDKNLLQEHYLREMELARSKQKRIDEAFQNINNNNNNRSPNVPQQSPRNVALSPSVARSSAFSPSSGAQGRCHSKQQMPRRDGSEAKPEQTRGGGGGHHPSILSPPPRFSNSQRFDFNFDGVPHNYRGSSHFSDGRGGPEGHTEQQRRYSAGIGGGVRENSGGQFGYYDSYAAVGSANQQLNKQQSQYYCYNQNNRQQQQLPGMYSKSSHSNSQPSLSSHSYQQQQQKVQHQTSPSVRPNSSPSHHHLQHSTSTSFSTTTITGSCHSRVATVVSPLPRSASSPQFNTTNDPTTTTTASGGGEVPNSITNNCGGGVGNPNNFGQGLDATPSRRMPRDQYRDGGWINEGSCHSATTATAASSSPPPLRRVEQCGYITQQQPPPRQSTTPQTPRQPSTPQTPRQPSTPQTPRQATTPQRDMPQSCLYTRQKYAAAVMQQQRQRATDGGMMSGPAPQHPYDAPYRAQEGPLLRPTAEPVSRPYPSRPKTRNGNVLSAVLCLIKELDYTSLEVAEMAIRCRMDELDD